MLPKGTVGLIPGLPDFGGVKRMSALNWPSPVEMKESRVLPPSNNRKPPSPP